MNDLITRGVGFIFHFEKRGTLAPETLLENHLWLDIGGDLRENCIDHHMSLSPYKSTLEALVDNINLICVAEARKKSESSYEVHIHLHENPDLDCMACVYVLLDYLTNNNKNEKHWKVLSRYVNQIDTGRGKYINVPTLYAVICMLDHDHNDQADALLTDEQILIRGVDALRLGVENLPMNDDGAALDIIGLTEILFRRDMTEVSGFAEAYGYEINEVKRARTLYQQQKENKEIWFGNTLIWNREGRRFEKIKAAVWHSASEENDFGYLFARQEGYALTCLPMRVHQESDKTEKRRCIISIDPDVTDHHPGYTLLPIAEMLEQMEQFSERQVFETEGYYRRDRSRPREETGIFSEIPFSSTADPWYIDASLTTIDSPGTGTVLSYDEIAGVIIQRKTVAKKWFIFAENKGQHNECIQREATPVAECIQAFKQAAAPRFAYMEMDASVLAKDNNMLLAFCNRMIDKPLFELDPKKIFLPDYRTCIYADTENVIVAAATSGTGTVEHTVLSGLIDTTQPNQSGLVMDYRKLLGFREKLEKLEDSFAGLNYSRMEENESNYRSLITLICDMQKEDMGIGKKAVRKEIYRYLKEALQMDELRCSVQEQSEIQMNEAREKQVEGFNLLSAFAVPFVLITTLFQAGIVRFDELFSLSGFEAKVGWAVVGVIIVFFIVFFRRKGKY